MRWRICVKVENLPIFASCNNCSVQAIYKEQVLSLNLHECHIKHTVALLVNGGEEVDPACRCSSGFYIFFQELAVLM